MLHENVCATPAGRTVHSMAKHDTKLFGEGGKEALKYPVTDSTLHPSG